ncbi:MAG: type II/IV secretion system ATPase subunit [Candidatus Diapherotrites archaeon]|nr:type II/IV secretion system ATPase subunit [Candidatus Diapherotrites archaeon]
MKYVIRDCSDCIGLGDISFPMCRHCIKPTKDLELIVYKNKIFTKQHYLKDDSYVIYPFFVDCLIKPVRGKVLKSYNIKDANVKIVQEEENLEPTYAISIPHLEPNMDQLLALYKEYESNELKNPLLIRWIKQHGILDYLMSDPKIQEININPPEFQSPFRIVHEDFDECRTNLYPSIDFLNYLATYLKINSGRPLNKAQPQLDAELTIENQRARVAAVVQPFSIHGIGYSIRRHREKPWTYPLFIANRTINPLFAGLMSFMITQGRTFLVAGPRGSGKTSLLGASVLEILPKYRIITIEDTQELPVNFYKEYGYDILSFKVRSALSPEGLEIPFEKGLKTCLRLGNSCLIIGEVRSKEARVLYEAMRVGAMANTVAGTIHADNPYGVFDRVVNDLGVPKGSFKVTDLIIIVKQIKSPTGLYHVRRVTRVVEVLKEWQDEPQFRELMVYDKKQDSLVPTKALLEGQSITIQNIMETSTEYDSFEKVWKDITLRAWAKERFVETLSIFKEKLEGPYTIKANKWFAELFESIKPLQSEEAENKFKEEFERRLQLLLK